ncbi:MAG: glycosyltransferase [Acidobacteria bacterium]|nr:glycosyltransferase [Acidobacteriota bacterium]
MTPRPPVAFVVLAYNQERYIREAVEGALAQTYDPLEIILSDDCSADRTFEIMRQCASDYTGPHRVSLNRNPANLGLCGHVSRAFSLGNADILVLGAGDDVSLPTRVSDTVNVFLRDPSVVSVSLKLRYVDHQGRVLRPLWSDVREGPYTLEDYAKGKRPPGLGASRAYRRAPYAAFGALSERCKVEDAALVFRGLLRGAVSHSNRVGVAYRVHDRNLSYGIDASAIKSLYRQHSRDLRFAERHWSLPSPVVARTRQALRDMMARGIIADRFYKSRFKAWVLLHRILFSPRFSLQAKRGYFRAAARQLLKWGSTSSGRPA